MSTTRDWMHGGRDWDRELERQGLPLGGVIVWMTSLIATVLGALALHNLMS